MHASPYPPIYSCCSILDVAVFSLQDLCQFNTIAISAPPTEIHAYTYVYTQAITITCIMYGFCVLATVAGTHEPVPVEDFPNHVRNLHANDDYLFTEEYAVSAFSL